MTDLDKLVSEATARFAAISDPAELERAKARFLGKSGAIPEAMKELARLAPAQRREAGARINSAKDRIEAALAAQLDARLAEEALDVTLPGRGRGTGSIHPVIRTWQRIEAIFGSIGFDVADGPEIETDWYNF